MAEPDDHLDQNVFHVLHQQLSATIKISKDNRQQFLEIGKTIKSLHQQMAAAIQAFGRQKEVIEQQLLLSDNLIYQFTKSSRRFTEAIHRLVNDLKKSELEDNESLKILANHGWYIDPEMPIGIPDQFARVIEKGDAQEVIKALQEYYQEQVDVIEKRLTTAYPNRKQVLEDAFNAHREGKFTLSVPVLLIQADGMWYDKFQSNFFSSKARDQTVKSVLSTNAQRFFKALYFKPLFSSSLPLWQSESEREASFDELNRHQVLHGEVVDYYTEQNSLKIIAFLNCLEWVLKHLDKESID